MKSLNVVEKLFRSWEAVHPYNAAQMVRLAAMPPCELANSAFAQTLEAMQLTPARLGRQTNSFAIHSPAAPVVVQPSISVEAHLSSEMNRPFSDEFDDWPFRPFIISRGDEHWLGLTYRHCIADSVSIRLLLRNWVAHCAGNGSAGSPTKQTDKGYWNLFAARDAKVRLELTVSSFLRGHHRLRTACKPSTAGEEDYPCRVLLGSAPMGFVDEWRARCREHGVRPTDSMLAALLDVSRKHVPLQSRGNRQDVAVGCIVNLRPYAHRDLSDTFGLYLGFTNVVASPRDFVSRQTLLDAVGRQTQMQRRVGIGPSCTMWVNAGLALGWFMPRDRLYHFYRKSMPLAAGLSRVRVRPEDSIGETVMDYVRISPTGPIAPLVLSATEINDRLSLALTYRPALINEASAQAVLDEFLDCLGRC